MPIARPRMSASRIRVGWESFKAVALLRKQDYLAYLDGRR